MHLVVSVRFFRYYAFLLTFSAPTLAEAKTLLDAHKVYHLICHRGPDGDALGSMLGLYHLLTTKYPGNNITLHCVDSAPDSFEYLPGVQLIEPSLTAEEGSLIICLDCAEAHMTMYHKTHNELFDKSQPMLVLDHHVSNPGFGTCNIVIPTASSACEIVLELATKWQWNVNEAAATCLLTGIYTDTGGLLHSNTSPNVYRSVATLLRAGADRQTIIKRVFRTTSVNELRLWGRILERVSITEEGGAVAAVTQEDFKATNTSASDLEGAIDYINAIPGMKFSLLLSEREGGLVKGSLRTLRDDVDVAAMAGKLDGGGHKKAAGFALNGKLVPEVRWKVVD